MVSLLQLATEIEQGLTSQLNDPNISFKIWANAGEYSKSVRSGNSVQSYIQGTLLSSSSSNEQNILSMGYNGLSLYLSVPLQAPKTLSTQTAAELQKIQNSQYPFLTLILSALDAYFSIASVMQLTDDAGTEYTVSMVAGRAITGNVDVAAQFGNNLTVSLLIGVYFLQGGVSARNVVLNIDGVRVPLSSLTVNRANQKASNVYQSGQTVKNFSSASALSIDFAFPANSDNTTEQAFTNLLSGENNVAHIVQLAIGSLYDGKYLMMFDNLNLAAQGVQFAGITGALIECVDNPTLLNFPAYMQVGKIPFANSTGISLVVQFSITQTISTEASVPDSISTLAYAAGKIYQIQSYSKSSTTNNNDGTQSTTYSFIFTFGLTPSSFIYNPTTNQYDFYIVNIEAAQYTNPTYDIVKEASTNG